MILGKAALTTLRIGLREGDWLTRQRLFLYPLVFFALYAIAAGLWLGLGEGLLDRFGHPFGPDFMELWAAARATLRGLGAVVYDGEAFGLLQQNLAGSSELPGLGWFHPPTTLLLGAPLGLVPYMAGLAAWLGGTLALYALVVWRLHPRIGTIPIALAFPAVFITAVHGQSAFLTTALLGGALVLLPRRPVVAGILMGLLAFKPHLALLLPVALAAGGHRRAFLAAAATVVAVGLAALAVLGAHPWWAFFERMAEAPRILEQGWFEWWGMQSVFAAVRLLGGPPDLAWQAQGLAALLAAGLLAALWRARLPYRLQAAAVVPASLLALPASFDDDLTLLALPLAWLAGAGEDEGFLPWERTILVVLWCLPLAARLIARLTGIVLAPAAMVALLALVLIRSWRAWRGGPGPLSLGGARS